jgi:hypothetical protein
MAVDIKYSICQSSNCESLTFTETTGVYNVTTNPTGWGAVGGGDPNEMLSDATIATLTLTGPDGTVYAPVDLLGLSSFPKDDIKFGYSITAASVDSSLSEFSDGSWTIAYNVTTGSTTYSESKTFFFSCQISACVYSMVADIDVSDCNCDIETLNKVLEAKAFLDALSYAVGCGNLTGANEILTTLQRTCSCS